MTNLITNNVTAGQRGDFLFGNPLLFHHVLPHLVIALTMTMMMWSIGTSSGGAELTNVTMSQPAIRPQSSLRNIHSRDDEKEMISSVSLVSLIDKPSGDPINLRGYTMFQCAAGHRMSLTNITYAGDTAGNRGDHLVSVWCLRCDSGMYV
jgi:hypothetical protein